MTPRIDLRQRTAPGVIPVTWHAGILFMGLVFSGLCSCTSFPTIDEIAPQVNATLKNSPLFLLAGDEIDVQFPRKPEWNQTAKVRDDGQVSFHFLGETTVVGFTVKTLADNLSKTLKARGILDDPDVTVNLVNIVPRRVAVMGEVNSPGMVEMDQRHLTFVEALAKAGGPNKTSARLSQAMLIRWLPHERKQQVWHLDARREHWKTGVPIYLQPHDVIFIPNTVIDKINIWVDKYIRQNLPLPLGIPVSS